MKCCLLLVLALSQPAWVAFADNAASGDAAATDAPKVSLDKLAPRPPNPAPSEQPKNGLNPMLSQKHLPRSGSKSKKSSDVHVRGGATSSYGGNAVGGVSTKVGEF
jgi:hypothetical protein